MSEMADWSDLLPEIVCKIAGEFRFYEDFANFLGVCGSWRSAVADDKSFTPPHSSRFPCLMLAESKTEEDEKFHRQFLFLSSSANGGTIHEVNLPESRNQQQHHCLSTQGWLLTIDKNDPFLAKLIHPFSGCQINLPKLYDYCGCDDDMGYMNLQLMRKVLIPSSYPLSDPNFFVAVVWGVSVGIWRAGDVSWSYRHTMPVDRAADMTYHRSRKQLYVATWSGAIFRWDIHEFCEKNAGGVHFDRSAFHPLTDMPQEWATRWMYLLEWDSNSLLVVTREYDTWGNFDGPDKTKGFQAFVFRFEDQNWSKLDSLGDRSIFVGFNSSFSINASSNGEGCKHVKPNCIYFTDESYLQSGLRFRDFPKEAAGQDTGFYHISSGSIEPLFDQQEQFISNLGPPLWLDTTN